MSGVLLLVDAQGSAQATLPVSEIPYRIRLPHGAAIETFDAASGDWKTVIPASPSRWSSQHDFSLLDE
jgi:hypothetical protein